MAECTECQGEGKRLGRYAGIAGSETPTIICPECNGFGFFEDEDDAQDRADDIRLDEQRSEEM